MRGTLQRTLVRAQCTGRAQVAHMRRRRERFCPRLLRKGGRDQLRADDCLKRMQVALGCAILLGRV